MGVFDDLTAKAAEIMYDTDVTYNPVGGDPFTARVALGRIIFNELDPDGMSNRRQMRILHSSFSENGISGPTAFNDSTAADTVTIQNANGEDETWEVQDSIYDGYGEWILDITTERRIRP